MIVFDMQLVKGNFLTYLRVCSSSRIRSDWIPKMSEQNGLGRGLGLVLVDLEKFRILIHTFNLYNLIFSLTHCHIRFFSLCFCSFVFCLSQFSIHLCMCFSLLWWIKIRYVWNAEKRQSWHAGNITDWMIDHLYNECSKCLPPVLMQVCRCLQKLVIGLKTPPMKT